MDWKNGRMTMTGDVLDRIVALLLAIADLAERAAGAPEARRRMVLAIIRSGETTVRDFVRAPDVTSTERPPVRSAAVPRSGHDPEDAMALALSLRALALILASMIARTRRLSFLAIDDAHDTNGYHVTHHGRCADTAYATHHRLDSS